jgi:hypothetical protein
MEVARPGGIVADAGFGIDLLTKELKKSFTTGDVYIHGLSEREPMRIFYSREYTKIEPQFTRPIQDIEWDRVRREFTLAKFRDLGPVFEWQLPSKPLDPDEILVFLDVPGRSDGRVVRGTRYSIRVPHHYELLAGQPIVVANHEAALKEAIDYGTGLRTKVDFKIDYPPG